MQRLTRCRSPASPSAQSSDLAATYKSALAYVNSGGDKSLKKPSQSQQLAFYGLYKQEACGKCNEKQPSRLQVVARAKHDAWAKLGSMSQEEARKEYVAALTKSDPSWQKKVKLKAKL